MLMVRLQRVGRKHEPTFRVVLTDSKNSTKSGRYVEAVGFYDPRRKEATAVNADRVTYWLGQGAQSSITVHNLLINRGLLSGKKRNALPKHRPPVKEKSPEAAPVVASTEPVAGEAETNSAVE